MSVWMFRRYYEEQEKGNALPAPVVEPEAEKPAEEAKTEPKKRQVKKTTKKK